MHFLFPSSYPMLAASLLLLSSTTLAQTYTSCNPLTTTCPAETALGKSISVDFTQGAVNSFTASGSPTYNSNGASFTVAKSGDSPQLDSLFYIMFGKVSVTMKAAPGAGIVSSVVLQSADLDEIDFEWLGADDTQVQTNYFGKGDVTTYNRGTYAAAPGNQANFITYTIEWTSTQIIWSVGGTVVRVLTPATADTNQYPQTPMQVKLGAWSGGDASNAAGTISWARGPTDYTKGPFSMIVKSMSIEDYSTGSAYTYSDMSGSWTSIKSTGGSINGRAPAAGSAASAQSPSATTNSPSIPAGIGSSTSTYSSIAIPSGWTVSSNGRIVPVSTATSAYLTSSASTPSSSPLSSTSYNITSSSSPTIPLSTLVTAPANSAGVFATAGNSTGFYPTATASSIMYTTPIATLSTQTTQPLRVTPTPTPSAYTGAGSLVRPVSKFWMGVLGGVFAVMATTVL